MNVYPDLNVTRIILNEDVEHVIQLPITNEFAISRSERRKNSVQTAFDSVSFPSTARAAGQPLDNGDSSGQCEGRQDFHAFTCRQDGRCYNAIYPEKLLEWLAGSLLPAFPSTVVGMIE